MGGSSSKPLQLRNPTATDQLFKFEGEYKAQLKGYKGKGKVKASKLQEQGAEVFYLVPKEAKTFGLNFSNCPTFGTPPALIALKNVLKEDNTLTSAFFENVTLTTTDGAKAMGDLVGALPALKFVSLANNKIGAAGAEALAGGLKEAKGLRGLYMPNTELGDKGVAAVAEALKACPNYLSINVCNCGIGAEGGNALVGLLEGNAKITGFCASGNSIPEDVMAKLTELHKKNFEAAKDELLKEVETNGEAYKAVGQEILQAKMMEKINKTAPVAVKDEKKDGEGDGEGTPPAGTPPVDQAGTPPANGGGEDQAGTPPAASAAADAAAKDEAPAPAPTPSVPMWVREEDEVMPVVESSRFVAGHAETWGRRPNMEDAVMMQGNFGAPDTQNLDLFGVFDGHGSRGPAVVAAKRIPEMFGALYKASGEKAFADLFAKAHAMINVKYPNTVGTTALMAVFDGNDLITANVGDTRAVLCRDGAAMRLSIDHRPDNDDEVKRIKGLGGKITDKRVQGILGVTRSLGDGGCHPYVTTEPYVNKVALTDKDRFLILACDGMYDTLSDDQAVNFAKCELHPDVCSGRLRDIAFEMGSTDNISVCVVQLSDCGWTPAA